MMDAFDLWQYRKMKPYIDAYDEARNAYAMARRYDLPEDELKELCEEMIEAEKALERAENRYDEDAYFSQD